ncbi:MAG: hypothetical protein U5J64_02150 [Halobacteriales archaeon]|nr:hypothetical protein [Halobacteriales archaeon]
MIGKNLRANAGYPIQSPGKIASAVIAIVVVLLYVVGFVIASSLSL